jgi:arabinofuranosyltransferase
MVLLLTLKRTSINQLTMLLLPFAIIYGSYFVWRFNFYGKLFPNTFYIKAPGTMMIRLGMAYGWHFFVHCAPYIPFALVVYRAFRSKRLIIGDINLLILMICVCYSIYVIIVGGDFMGLYRFMMPILPLTYILFYRLYSSSVMPRNTLRNKLPPIVALVIFAIINIISCVRSREISLAYNVDSIGVLKNYVNTWGDVGRLLLRISRPTDTIAVTAAGTIPYYSQLYTIDMLGLEAVDQSGFEFNNNFIRPGHVYMISSKYLIEAKPQFIIAHPQIVEGYSDKYPDYLTESIGSALRNDYTIASIKLPNMPWYNWQFWVRNDIIPRIPGPIKYYRIGDIIPR